MGGYGSSMEPPLLTKRELAGHLKYTPRYIEKLHGEGLPHYKFGPRSNRYDLDQVKVWMTQRLAATRIGAPK